MVWHLAEYGLEFHYLSGGFSRSGSGAACLAMVDGAGKLKRIIHIDLPAILPTMVILLIMNAGNIMSIGYEKVYLMQNDLNLTTAEVISTYVYKIGLKQQQYSYSAAIGLFNNVLNFILLVIVNKISKEVSVFSLW